MPQPKLPWGFQKPASKQGDTSNNCSYKWGKLAESPEKIKHSEQDMPTPCPFSYQKGICWSHSHSTWTYRSFVLYRRATNRLAIRCHTPAVSSVGMALHLFDKAKSRHFISHSLTHHCYYKSHFRGSPSPEASQGDTSEQGSHKEEYCLVDTFIFFLTKTFSSHLPLQRRAIFPTPLAAIQEVTEVTETQLRTLHFGYAAIMPQLIPPFAKCCLLFIIK